MSTSPDRDVDADAESDTNIETAEDTADISTANTTRERANESRIKPRVLLSANRLLVAYIAHIATIAKRTLAIGPLISRRSQR